MSPIVLGAWPVKALPWWTAVLLATAGGCRRRALAHLPRRRPSAGQQRDPCGLNKTRSLVCRNSLSNFYLWTMDSSCKLHSGQAPHRHTYSLRPRAATKKPSVPWRAGVSRSAPRCRLPSSADSLRLPASHDIAPRQRAEARMVREERGDLVAILLAAGPSRWRRQAGRRA